MIKKNEIIQLIEKKDFYQVIFLLQFSNIKEKEFDEIINQISEENKYLLIEYLIGSKIFPNEIDSYNSLFNLIQNGYLQNKLNFWKTN